VAWAESVSVAHQDRADFKAKLGQALASEAQAKVESLKLSNAVSARRARWLLARADKLFLADDPDTAPAQGGTP